MLVFLQKNYKWGPWDKETIYPTDGNMQQWYHHDNSALMFQTWARCFFISVLSSQGGIKSSFENIEKSWVLPLILCTPHSHYYHWFSCFQCFVHRGETKDFNFQISESLSPDSTIKCICQNPRQCSTNKDFCHQENPLKMHYKLHTSSSPVARMPWIAVLMLQAT